MGIKTQGELMITKIKKTYLAPALNIVQIDREITLVMGSPGEPPPFSPALPPEKDAGEKGVSPFGSDKPDYSKM